MKLTLTILFFAWTIGCSFGQPLNSKQIETNQKKLLGLTQKEPGAVQYLKIEDKDGNIKRQIKLPEEYDPYRFTAYFSGEREFAVIGGRYKCYLFNLHTKKLIGPLSASVRGDAQDAQSGVLNHYQVLDHGQYLLVNAMDFGVTCFRLADLYHPEALDFFKADSSYFFRGKFTFIDQRKTNLYNVITATCGNYKDTFDAEMLIQGGCFQQDENGQIIHRIVSGKYLVLTSIRESNMEKVVIDLDAGTLVDPDRDSSEYSKIIKE